MNARVKLLEERAQKTAAAIADRREILDFFKDIGAEDEKTADCGLADQTAPSSSSGDRTALPEHRMGLQKSFSTPEIARPRRPAERTGLASPPNHPLHLRLTKAVQMASKNAGEIHERRTWLDEKNQNQRVTFAVTAPNWSSPTFDRESTMFTPMCTGSDWEGVGVRQRHVPEKYLSILQGAGHGLTKEPPNVPLGPTNSIKHRLQIFEDRAMWNASKIASQRQQLSS